MSELRWKKEAFGERRILNRSSFLVSKEMGAFGGSLRCTVGDSSAGHWGSHLPACLPPLSPAPWGSPCRRALALPRAEEIKEGVLIVLRLMVLRFKTWPALCKHSSEKGKI